MLYYAVENQDSYHKKENASKLFFGNNIMISVLKKNIFSSFGYQLLEFCLFQKIITTLFICMLKKASLNWMKGNLWLFFFFEKRKLVACLLVDLILCGILIWQWSDLLWNVYSFCYICICILLNIVLSGHIYCYIIYACYEVYFRQPALW